MENTRTVLGFSAACCQSCTTKYRLFALQTVMKHVSLGSKYLKDRCGWWHYMRRVPERFKDVDKRSLIEAALRAQSHEVAMMWRLAHSMFFVFCSSWGGAYGTRLVADVSECKAEAYNYFYAPPTREGLSGRMVRVKRSVPCLDVDEVSMTTEDRDVDKDSRNE